MLQPLIFFFLSSHITHQNYNLTSYLLFFVIGLFYIIWLIIGTLIIFWDNFKCLRDGDPSIIIILISVCLLFKSFYCMLLVKKYNNEYKLNRYVKANKQEPVCLDIKHNNITDKPQVTV